MNQQEFDILLKKYLSGECNQQEIAFVLAWYEKQYPNEGLLTSHEQEEMQTRVFQRIEANLWAKEKTTVLNWKYFAVAASLLFFVSSFFLISYLTADKNLAGNHAPQKGIEMKNTSASDKNITLEDGSIVTLEANSSLSYPEHFGDVTREVYLKGEAFFSVKKNPNKPFIVHAGEVTTEVLGTSFRVKSYEDKRTIEVAVVTGRVSVFKNSTEKKRNGLILTPNQQIVFNRETKEIVPSIVENPQVIVSSPTINLMIFEEETLDKVLSKLTKAYGIEIFVENQILNKCVFTGDLNGLVLTTQLDLICKAIGAKFEQRGTSIFISGGGCL
jgi:transmembrane sensor